MIWGIYIQIGNGVPAPARGGQGGKDLDYVDMQILNERARQAENNARAAVLIAVMEADDE